MTITTQLTLTGQEAEDYLAYRVRLKELGCNSFNELRKKDKLREIDANYADMIKQVHDGIMSRQHRDKAYIIGGGQINNPQDFINVFKRTLEAFIKDYVKSDKNRPRFKAEADNLADKLFEYYTK